MFAQILVLLLLPLNIASANVKKKPLSKIVITSNNAECKKSDRGNYIFTYIDNVLVKLADNSTINSDKLEIELDTKKTNLLDQTNTTTSPHESQLSQFKKITFLDNVFIKRTNRTVKTNKAELFLEKKECKLLGNVEIEQTKINPKDLPIKTFCNEAILNLETEKLTLLGQTQKPVNTEIILENHPSLLKKIKTKKEKKAERKK